LQADTQTTVTMFRLAGLKTLAKFKKNR